MTTFGRLPFYGLFSALPRHLVGPFRPLLTGRRISGLQSDSPPHFFPFTPCDSPSFWQSSSYPYIHASFSCSCHPELAKTFMRLVSACDLLTSFVLTVQARRAVHRLGPQPKSQRLRTTLHTSDRPHIVFLWQKQCCACRKSPTLTRTNLSFTSFDPCKLALVMATFRVISFGGYRSKLRHFVRFAGILCARDPFQLPHPALDTILHLQLYLLRSFDASPLSKQQTLHAPFSTQRRQMEALAKQFWWAFPSERRCASHVQIPALVPPFVNVWNRFWDTRSQPNSGKRSNVSENSK